MSEFLVRLKGKPEEYMSKLLDQGYFNTKSEIVRLGIIEISKRYLEDDISKNELELVGKAVEKELKNNAGKLKSEKYFKKKYSKLL